VPVDCVEKGCGTGHFIDQFLVAKGHGSGLVSGAEHGDLPEESTGYNYSSIFLVYL
jgi:hypothetical protein